MNNFWKFITRMSFLILKKEFQNICSFSVATRYLTIIQVEKPLYKFLLMRKQKPLKILTPNKSYSLVIHPNNNFANKNDTFGKLGNFLSEYHFQVNKF